MKKGKSNGAKAEPKLSEDEIQEEVLLFFSRENDLEKVRVGQKAVVTSVGNTYQGTVEILSATAWGCQQVRRVHLPQVARWNWKMKIPV